MKPRSDHPPAFLPAYPEIQPNFVTIGAAGQIGTYNHILKMALCVIWAGEQAGFVVCTAPATQNLNFFQ
jgi:TRAP-type uncharacterized transport system substrate-binding protein